MRIDLNFLIDLELTGIVLIGSVTPYGPVQYTDSLLLEIMSTCLIKAMK